MTRSFLTLGLLAALVVPVATLSANMDKKMMDQMEKKLDLSADQTKQMKELHKQEQKVSEERCGKMDADVASLKALLKNKASDTELTALITTVQDEHKAMAMSMHENCEAMLKILTPTQQAKMLIHMHKHMGEMGGMGHGDDEKHEHKGKKTADKDDDK